MDRVRETLRIFPDIDAANVPLREVWVVTQPTIGHYQQHVYRILRGFATDTRTIAPLGSLSLVVDPDTGQVLGEYARGGLFPSEQAARAHLAYTGGKEG